MDKNENYKCVPKTRQLLPKSIVLIGKCSNPVKMIASSPPGETSSEIKIKAIILDGYHLLYGMKIIYVDNIICDRKM